MKKSIISIIFLFCLIFINTEAQEPTAPTENEVLVKVAASDDKGNPRSKDIIYFTDLKTKKYYVDSTGDDGKFNILLPKGKTFNIQYRNLTDTVNYGEVQTSSKPGFSTLMLTLELSISESAPVILRGINFDFGKASLRPESYKALKDLYDIMQYKNTLVIEISGHTDNIGTSESNITLSQQRAEAVRNYLINRGIESSRVTAKGYGDTMPVADNSTEAGRAINRRTEVHILKQ